MDTYRSLNGVLFHTMTPEDVMEYTKSCPEGISDDEAHKRALFYGPNKLNEARKKSILIKFIEQFKNLMVIVLLVASFISLFLGEYTDSIIIIAVVFINAVLGVIQESKAEKALEALKKMSSPYAKVKRNGETKLIKTEEIVPGDIVLIEAGDFVPADIRLIESASLKIEEAALTGESMPVEKSTEQINNADIVIGDRRNMAYLGSSVTYGRGMGIVVGTGMNTEMGKIADLISKNDEDETPLQKKLTELGKYLSVATVVISIIIFIAGLIEGRKFYEMFFIAVSLSVAAIPEGLPAIVTIVLALGVQKMAKRNAIIRKLPAVETLGSTEIICSDKTGTLTQNRMTVKELFVGGRLLKTEDISTDDNAAAMAMQVMILCNDSKVTRIDDSAIRAIGDPTETALVEFGSAKGFFKDNMDNDMPRVAEIPFDSDRKLMTTINNINGHLRIMTKGAPDVLLERCSRAYINGSVVPIDDSIMESVKAANSSMASKALRVLALAYKDTDTMPADMDPVKIENDLIFVGLVGMIDPPREEVKESVRICRNAGIRPIMITGDHKDTASAIAKELNIIKNDSEVITGKELDKISEEDFAKQVDKYSVYARVSPEHKVRIVNAWKKRGKTVAMTGDGVNDAPALKAADIGVGMGITGTDVAKGVSDMVLSDDNFATIVAAVEEGRTIYNNIRKAIQFLLSANMGEIITLFVATMLNWKILLPIHILWINLVTDTFPALALGFEKAEKDIMQQMPRKSRSSIFSDGLGFNIIYQGILEGMLTLAVYYIASKLYTVEVAITVAFATLGLVQLAHSFNVRSATKSVFKLGLLSNMYIIAAFVVSALLQLIVILVPQLNIIFRTTHLNLKQWGLVFIASFSIIPLVEIIKLIQNIINKSKRKKEINV